MTPRESELLPCPFCGEIEARLEEYKDEYGVWYVVRCNFCDAQAEKCRTQISATKAWNNRLESKLSAQVDERTTGKCRNCGHDWDGQSEHYCNSPLTPVKLSDEEMLKRAFFYGYDTASDCVRMHANTVLLEQQFAKWMRDQIKENGR